MRMLCTKLYMCRGIAVQASASAALRAHLLKPAVLLCLLQLTDELLPQAGEVEWTTGGRVDAREQHAGKRSMGWVRCHGWGQA